MGGEVADLGGQLGISGLARGQDAQRQQPNRFARNSELSRYIGVYPMDRGVNEPPYNVGRPGANVQVRPRSPLVRVLWQA